MTGTDRSIVAGQARAIADAWSPPGAPESWWLTAATFAAIAEEDVLLDLAAAIPTDRLAGDPGAAVRLDCAVRSGTPPVPPALPVIADRVGIDVEPLDVGDPQVLAWLAACVPPEAGAVTRFAAASGLAMAEAARSVRGSLVDVLPDVVASLPSDTLVCLVDTYVHVFLPPADLARFDRLLLELGRDLDWVSVDPLVPLGPAARATVQGLDVPDSWVRENRDGGVSGVIGRVSVRDGVRTAALLGRTHPGAAWLEWWE